jgi:hypothetical protein
MTPPRVSTGRSYYGIPWLVCEFHGTLDERVLSMLWQ